MLLFLTTSSVSHTSVHAVGVQYVWIMQQPVSRELELSGCPARLHSHANGFGGEALLTVREHQRTARTPPSVRGSNFNPRPGALHRARGALNPRAGHVPSPPRSCRFLRFRFAVGPPRSSVLRFRDPPPPPFSFPPPVPCFGCPPPLSVSDGRIPARSRRCSATKSAGSTTLRAGANEDSGGVAPDEYESRLEGHGNAARKRSEPRIEAHFAMIPSAFPEIFLRQSSTGIRTKMCM